MEVGDLLEDCLSAAKEHPKSVEVSDSVKLKYKRCRESLCEELASLLEEAEQMKWPFVPERWQYKQSISPTDKTNLNDLIGKNVQQLLDLLKSSIMAQEPQTSLAVIFLVDRFLYWIDESTRLLKITKLLNQHYPEQPIAPQLIIRQARVYLNSGKLQKTESILSSLIYRNGTTGCWVYHCDSDKVLVQAVSVQVRGMVLQKLGLWLQAAELIWASLVGYYSLPQPDKKGIGTSLGLLANILVSMSDEDFHAFKTNPDIEFLSLLGNAGSHRLLSAAQAAKMAVVYSQYASLYVLTNVTAQGTCLLSYSFSLTCPPSQRTTFLQKAREAFAIGLLTKAEGEPVTSQQELHTFLKAAYSMTVTDKWLDAPKDVVEEAAQACQQALGYFYKYCDSSTQDKDGLSVRIMQEVAKVKQLLGVEPFPNSDKGSFIPDSYRNAKDYAVNFTLEGFSKMLERYQKFHASLCEATKDFKKTKGKDAKVLTALNLSMRMVKSPAFDKESLSEAVKQIPRSLDSSSMSLSQNVASAPIQESTDLLRSPCQMSSTRSSGSPEPSGGAHSSGSGHRTGSSDQSNVPTNSDDDNDDSFSCSPDENKKQKPESHTSGIASYLVPKFTIPKTTSHSQQFEESQAKIETEDSDTDSQYPNQQNCASDITSFPNPKTPSHSLQSKESQAEIQTDVSGLDSMTDVNGEENEGSLSQLELKETSSSFGESFSSQSSWGIISTGQNSPLWEKVQPGYVSKPRTLSSGSDGSFVIVETQNSESSSSPASIADHKPLERHDVHSNMKLEANSRPVKPASVVQGNPSQRVPDSNATTESSGSSDDMVELNENGHQSNEVTSAGKAPQNKNTLCYSCLYPSTTASPDRQFELSQHDYQALLAGICHECLQRRLYSKTELFQLQQFQTAHNALHLKFSKATGLWTARETCVYIGRLMEMEEEGNQRRAIWVQFLHQEERLSSYVGKDYLKPREIQYHLNDVARQMTAQYYVTEFNKSLYDKEVLAQIFYIPSDALLASAVCILNGGEIVGCITVEPYMLGDFVKLTNNTGKKEMSVEATKYGLAFGHFTYLFSGRQEVVVDLQGWTTSSGKGLTYLTDPQIHSTRTPRGPSNFGERGLAFFRKDQHGPTCNEICNLLRLPPLPLQFHV
ncbi:alpha-protein kinase 1 isoform X1 [Xiphophorus hellerii]|uniref:alpha-protein kinase 1 isoform X1 n=1 Tax=Xiphophorus hellerii TaxID=8084 RepID=UPI0013B38067|nr:alpha-protein kinase 1 isoform X1 [Xiphophorus hellerii]XP_032439932.1 alpha-protein kinase 1 isoform X1 [Xiphophorus hellerii]XP_032439933.1 alpha-protein kinase 1 isoform X1 [Xiphophorus hellerii]